MNYKLNDEFVKQIERTLSQNIGCYKKVVSFGVSGGGCINNGIQINTENGDSFFVKYNQKPPKNMFQCEKNGLDELRKSEALRIPLVYGVSDRNYGDDVPDHRSNYSDNVPSFIILEHIHNSKSSKSSKSFYEDFGRELAKMHKFTSDKYGFYEDNYIGSTPQRNTVENDWVEFFGKHRIENQLRMAKNNGLATRELIAKTEQLLNKLGDIMGNVDEPPALLHGDLWSGNYMVDENGDAVLIDPATYYGSRETDLAMTEMFGVFPSSFYSSYNEEYPIQKGYDDRKLVYKLYHYMNHLNLFGSGYLGSCLSILSRLSSI